MIKDNNVIMMLAVDAFAHKKKMRLRGQNAGTAHKYGASGACQ